MAGNILVLLRGFGKAKDGNELEERKVEGSEAGD
jgi:hypothetical protein